MNVFQVTLPQGPRVPVLLSIPHCGTAFPVELADQYQPELAKQPDDTDWHVDRLYDFAPSMGITMVSAVYSRWVIDLNRDPKSKPLYSDGRIITALCPTTDFWGKSIYKDERKVVDQVEVERRLAIYYEPYHRQIENMLNELKAEFGHVLLWECHSIRQHVPSIYKEKFPDLILGDVDGTAASPGLIETALREMEKSNYSVSHNHPFKGGYITRNFGKPMENQHAIQLEMSKIIYLDDRELSYDAVRAEKLRTILKSVFEKLIMQLT